MDHRSYDPRVTSISSTRQPTARKATARSAGWQDVRARLHARGLRWTPQRRALVDVLAASRGHVTGAELVERCRAVDPSTTPSTVYRTLDVLEDLGLVRHAHGADGREEYHVLPGAEHGHIHCARCGAAWELGADELAGLAADQRARRGFVVDVSHVTVVGLCAACAAADAADRA
jgi:Fur family ferric uptake transcriptional regulator